MARGLWQSLEVMSWGLYEKCHLLTSRLCNLSHTLHGLSIYSSLPGTQHLGLGTKSPLP